MGSPGTDKDLIRIRNIRLVDFCDTSDRALYISTTTTLTRDLLHPRAHCHLPATSRTSTEAQGSSAKTCDRLYVSCTRLYLKDTSACSAHHAAVSAGSPPTHPSYQEPREYHARDSIPDHFLITGTTSIRDQRNEQVRHHRRRMFIVLEMW